jgi:hypothetical protein
MKKNVFESLYELTGRESGLVVYNNECILCNWRGIYGLPRISPIGTLIGLWDDIKCVKSCYSWNVWAEGYIKEDMTAHIFGFVNNDGDIQITGGKVYILEDDLEDDVVVICPDGWE